MAKNFVQQGDVIAITATAALKAGDGVVVGSIFGVATVDAAIGDTCNVAVEGVWQLPKANVALAQGAKAFWNVAAKQVVAAAGTGVCSIGAVTEAAGSAAPSVRVRLDESATTVG